MSSVVYFIESCGRVKIGVTTHLKNRLGQLSTSSPYPPTLIGSVPGDVDDEAKFHERLAAHRVNGEWFTDCIEVRAVVLAALAGRGAFPESPSYRPPEDRQIRPVVGKATEEDTAFDAFRAMQERIKAILESEIVRAVKAAGKSEIDLKVPPASITSTLVDLDLYVEAFSNLRKNHDKFARLLESAMDAEDDGEPCAHFIRRAELLVASSEEAFRRLVVLKPDAHGSIHQMAEAGQR